MKVDGTDGIHRTEWFVAFVLAIGLTIIFWHPLWQGSGLTGGDTYTYFYPQKCYLAERLSAGEFPLWNRLAGHGYPLIAESQTGALYPFHFVGYAFFDVQEAYNAIQIVHYVLAFLLTWMYARRLGLKPTGALFAALVFTYAWFPFRISLEWAIITGAWFPAALWCAESFIQTRWWRYAILLAFVLGLQMLAGHFNLAFITQLVLVIYFPARLLWVKHSRDVATKKTRGILLGFSAIAFGFLLASVQLLPTWELKQLSQRADVGKEHDPKYGHSPVWCWTQIIAPWNWYGLDRDLSKEIPEGESRTNDVEAHIYFGLIPLALLVVTIFQMLRNHQRIPLRLCWFWLILSACGMIYMTGWLIPVTRYLPGFSFFEGPGRYSLVVTFGVAVLAAFGLESIVSRLEGMGRNLLIAAVFVGTCGDLHWVARQVPNVAIVENPPLLALNQSPLKQKLQEEAGPVRLFSRGANLPTLLGVSSTPIYLGFAPSAYFDPQLTIPQPIPYETPPTAAQEKWLRNAGVTHILAYSQLDETRWPVSLIWSGYDSFYNRAGGHPRPLFLYRFQTARGRAYWANEESEGGIEFEEFRANVVRVKVNADQQGQLVLAELSYPGWEASVDGKPVSLETAQGMYRSVNVPAGEHTVEWRFRPTSFSTGLWISLASVFILAGIAHLRFWHPGLFSEKQQVSRDGKKIRQQNESIEQVG
ncbi:MAG: hypothetical protein Tsb009_33780 [Planctomycetaceae bacterium]